MDNECSVSLVGNPSRMFDAVKDARLRNLEQDLAKIDGITIYGIEHFPTNSQRKHTIRIKFFLESESFEAVERLLESYAKSRDYFRTDAQLVKTGW